MRDMNDNGAWVYLNRPTSWFPNLQWRLLLWLARSFNVRVLLGKQERALLQELLNLAHVKRSGAGQRLARRYPTLAAAQ